MKNAIFLYLFISFVSITAFAEALPDPTDANFTVTVIASGKPDKGEPQMGIIVDDKFVATSSVTANYDQSEWDTFTFPLNTLQKPKYLGVTFLNGGADNPNGRELYVQSVAVNGNIAIAPEQGWFVVDGISQPSQGSPKLGRKGALMWDVASLNTVKLSSNSLVQQTSAGDAVNYFSENDVAYNGSYGSGSLGGGGGGGRGSSGSSSSGSSGSGSGSYSSGSNGVSSNAITAVATAALSSTLDASANSASAPGVYRTADFLNTWGICAHIGGATTGPLGDLSGIKNELAYVGISRVRADLSPGKRPAIASLMQLAGTHFELINNVDPTNNAAWSAQHTWLEQNVANIDGMEGNNEVDIQALTYNGVTGINIPGAIAIQKILYPMIKNDSVLKNIPVLNFTEGHTVNPNPAVGDMSAYADFGNMHAYSNGSPPYLVLPMDVANTVDTPERRTIMTETGQTTVVYNSASPTLTCCGVSEDLQSKDILDELLDNFKNGIVKTYIYELLDEVNDPGNTQREDHFGLFHYDETPKPAATVLHNFYALIHDAGSNSGVFGTTALGYNFTQSSTAANMDANQFHLLTQKQSGTYEMVLWAEPKEWQSNAPLPPPTPNAIIINLDRKIHQVNIYDPYQGISALASYTNTDQIVVSTVDHPIVVEMIP